MIRVVLDTSQIVSALINPGGLACEILISSGLQGEQKNELVTSEEILTEIERVLNYPRIKKLHGWSGERIGLFLNLLKEHASIVATKPPFKKIVLSDPEDDKFFHTAIQAGASYIISRDEHLLKIKEYGNVRVLKPKVFISAMRNNAL
ncbi:MAG: putative toxin-antitoxin system toxin component, PIN family [Proteobacteria bacterium]|nr:putative toxin-antitoxin system toxin component, PIN family [Pseudomonadota bacterium]